MALFMMAVFHQKRHLMGFLYTTVPMGSSVHFKHSTLENGGARSLPDSDLQLPIHKLFG